MSDACAHYVGLPTALRHPTLKERFKSARENTCVCECGICLGWRSHNGKRFGFNPIINPAQRDSVARFLTGHGMRVDA